MNHQCRSGRRHMGKRRSPSDPWRRYPPAPAPLPSGTLRDEQCTAASALEPCTRSLTAPQVWDQPECAHTTISRDAYNAAWVQGSSGCSSGRRSSSAAKQPSVQPWCSRIFEFGGSSTRLQRGDAAGRERRSHREWLLSTRLLWHRHGRWR